MNDLNKETFTRIMSTTCKQYSKSEFDENVNRLWYHSLKIFELPVIIKAVEKWILTSKFMPTVSDIVKLCRLEVQQQNQNNQLGYKVNKKDKLAFQKKLNEAVNNAKLKTIRHPKLWAINILKRHDENKYESTVGLEMAREVVDSLSSKERSELGL